MVTSLRLKTLLLPPAHSHPPDRRPPRAINMSLFLPLFLPHICIANPEIYGGPCSVASRFPVSHLPVLFTWNLLVRACKKDHYSSPTGAIWNIFQAYLAPGTLTKRSGVGWNTLNMHFHELHVSNRVLTWLHFLRDGLNYSCTCSVDFLTPALYVSVSASWLLTVQCQPQRMLETFTCQSVKLGKWRFLADVSRQEGLVRLLLMLGHFDMRAKTTVIDSPSFGAIFRGELWWGGGL